MRKIGEVIKLAREAKKTDAGKAWTQDRLAEAVGVSKQWISGIETGKKDASLSLLVNLHETLVGTGDQESSGVLLSTWLLAWLEKQVQDESLTTEQKETTQKVIEKAVAHLIQPLMSHKPSPQRSLEHFPYPSEPLTIVCGDRRELNPKTRGDIFAHSVSITDLTFLLRLGLPKNVTIRSDKLFVLMGREYLEREFGKTNLLVIGSPAVNFAARVINNYSVFRFNFPQWLKAKEEQLRTLKEPEDWEKQLLSLKKLNDRQNLEVFWQLAQHPDEVEFAARESDPSPEDQRLRGDLVKRILRKANITADDIEQVRQLARVLKKVLDGETAKSLMNQFRIPGLMDFSDVTLHAMSTKGEMDFALISLAPNPFSATPNYVCVMVAGIHGPGTAHALRALAEDDFHEHPFGGIIEVELDQFDDWPTRFQHASWRWQTKKYDADKLLANLRSALEQSRDARPRVFKHLTDAEIKECVSFVEHIAEVSASD